MNPASSELAVTLAGSIILGVLLAAVAGAIVYILMLAACNL